MKSCLCLVLWHASPEFYTSLSAVPELDLFVIMHRPAAELPSWLPEVVPQDRVFFEPNRGYDWGAYQQFLDKGIYKDYPYVFFAHDDLTLLDPGLFAACVERIAARSDACVIGNGRVTTKQDWPRTHIFCYAHSRWKPPGWDFCHPVVRGSFFGTSRAALERIERFEVLWDRRRLIGVGAGNWSTRATCGRIQDRLGDGAFHFLSEDYLSSPYLLEHERGGPSAALTSALTGPRRSWRYRSLVWVSTWLMSGYMRSRSPASKRKLAGLMERLYQVI